jgi:hypothetical protein
MLSGVSIEKRAQRHQNPADENDNRAFHKVNGSEQRA